MKKHILSTLIAVGLVGSASAAIVAQWNFNGNANDSVGSANGIANGISYISSTINGASQTVASFNGSSLISIAEKSNIKLGSNFTISAYININSFNDASVNGGFEILSAGGVPDVSQASYVAGVTAWSIDINMSGLNDYPINSKWLHQRAYSDGTTVTSTLPSQPLGLELGQWNSVAWVYDGSSMKAYLKGSFLGNALTYSTIQYISPYDGFGTLTFGKNFVGQMADISIYNEALTATEISQLYPTAVPEPGTFLPAALLVAGALLRRRRGRASRSGRATA
jgi:uncharacterized protein (TIGR03382 family)